MRNISLKIFSYRSAFFLLSLIWADSSFGQKSNPDSSASEIKSLLIMSTQLEARVDSLSTQLVELYSIREGLKTKIENLEKELEKAKAERTTLQQKQDVTPDERNKLNNWQKVEDKKNRFVQSAAELEQNYNDHMAVLDQTIAEKDQLDDRIKQLQDGNKSAEVKTKSQDMKRQKNRSQLNAKR